MAQDDFAKIELQASGKHVMIPRDMLRVGDKISIRQYAYESGQATKEEAGISSEFSAEVNNPLYAALLSAGKTVADFDLNAKQALAELVGDKPRADEFKRGQFESNQTFDPVASEYPVSTDLGGAAPFFAVPGGKAAQIGFGALEGGLRGDTGEERAKNAALGATFGLIGQKAGDYIGARFQNSAQRMLGNPNAAARRELLDAGIPLSLSQRTDGVISKPLSTFFERGRFVFTGKQPQGAIQQRKITEMITDALGVKGGSLTRETLGKAVEQNTQVFRNAASRVKGNIVGDDAFFKAVNDAAIEFSEVGTDSPQVKRIFTQFIDQATDPRGIAPEKFLKLRSDLSAATVKSDIETDSLVTAINAMDDHLARISPDLAEDLLIARDRFRLLLAVRRGSALSPQGSINLPTLTKNLERVFRDFDANKPLPGVLRNTGESIAALNQVVTPLRSSGSAENAAALALPGGAMADPSVVLKAMLGLSAPFSGGGTGGLLGGGVGRSTIAAIQEKQKQR